jgi:RNA polymerase sigma-70 factor, ECF subfamily
MEKNTSERKLINGLRENDPGSFRLLFDKYYTLLVRYALKITNNHIVAEEIVQEIFIKLWEHRDKVNECDSLSAYLYISTRNRCLNYFKSKIRSFTWEDNLENMDQVDDHTPLEILSYDELSRKIETATENLPEQCKIIFNLSRFSDLSNKEIAKHLSISEKTVENQMTIALKKLRRALYKYLQTILFF